jgi:hypothetical protein
MRQLQNGKNMADMLGAESAVLFVFVDWSEYARRGAELIERAEVQFMERLLGRSVSWWIGDFSSIESPIAPVVHHWLTEQEQRRALHLFPSIATGDGSVVWMNRGEIVSFAASAVRLGIEGVLQRTEELMTGEGQ